jgi:hypothetical protein
MMWPSDVFTLLTRIDANVTRLLAKETVMALDLTTLTAEVSRNTTVAGSVETLLAQLTAIIKTIPPSTDPTTQAALEQLAATLASNDTAVSAAVVANTPAAATPPATTPIT